MNVPRGQAQTGQRQRLTPLRYASSVSLMVHRYVIERYGLPLKHYLTKEPYTVPARETTGPARRRDGDGTAADRAACSRASQGRVGS
jgi:hypothetical protein